MVVWMRARVPGTASLSAFLLFACSQVTFSTGSGITDESLEDLAVRFGTDKGMDEHGYVSLYAMLFDSMRAVARNVTEIGVASGVSLQVWNDYFPQAHIWGIDIKLIGKAIARARPLERVHLLAGSQLDSKFTTTHRLANMSMDIVIDDGLHRFEENMATMATFFDLVRPGGYYIVEDVITGGNAAGLLNDKHINRTDKSETPVKLDERVGG